MQNGYIKFWGVRGSRATAESDKMIYGGDTSCVEIRTEENDLILLESLSADTQKGFAAMFGKGAGAFGRKPPPRTAGK